ncbi:MAG: DUF2294 domain-containing protein [Spirochaetales bacterium]|nr:DUF2294 domain-containing protein [Spirochaetales bacterium]
MAEKSKGKMEAEISDAVIRFEKEFMGRGPLETKSYILDDMVIVRLRDVLTPAEKKLAQADDPNDGRVIIKRMRHALLEKGRPLLEASIAHITGRTVISVHSDLSTKTGEKIIIFSMDKKLPLSDTQ